MAQIDPNDPVFRAYDRGGLDAVTQTVREIAQGDVEKAGAVLESRAEELTRRHALTLQGQAKYEPPPPPGIPPRSFASFYNEAKGDIEQCVTTALQGTQQDRERGQQPTPAPEIPVSPEPPGQPEPPDLAPVTPAEVMAQDPVSAAFQQQGLPGAVQTICAQAKGDRAAAFAAFATYRAGLEQAENQRLQEQASLANPARSLASIAQEARHNIMQAEVTIDRQMQQEHDRAVIKDAAIPVHWESYGGTHPDQIDSHIARDAQGETVAHIYPTTDTGPVTDQTRYTLHMREFGKEPDDFQSKHHLSFDEARHHAQEHINAYRKDARHDLTERTLMREKVLADFRRAAHPDDPPPPGGISGRGPDGDTPPPPGGRDGGSSAQGPEPPSPDDPGGRDGPPSKPSDPSKPSRKPPDRGDDDKPSDPRSAAEKAEAFAQRYLAKRVRERERGGLER